MLHLPAAARPKTQQQQSRDNAGVAASSMTSPRQTGPVKKKKEATIRNEDVGVVDAAELVEPSPTSPLQIEHQALSPARLRKPPRQSKLEAEVERMEVRGNALIRREGQVVEGAALLQRALWARARFNALRQRPQDYLWRYGEDFVVTCNHLAMNAIQTLSGDYINVSNSLVQLAERSLTDPVNDPFTEFTSLRHHLIGATLNNLAVLQRLTDDKLENVINTLHRALLVEGGRMSSLTLFNLAAAYVQCNRFDDACEAVTRCIELVNHYLVFPVRHETVGWAEFVAEVATHATLAHHLIASLAQWSDLSDVCLHHCQLALACAAKHLGRKHALTSRCLDRLRAVESALARRKEGSFAAGEKGSATFFSGANDFSGGDEDAPPLVPFHLSFTTNSRPSQLLPFALAYPVPDSVLEFVNSVRKVPLVLPHAGESFLPTLGKSSSGTMLIEKSGSVSLGSSSLQVGGGKTTQRRDDRSKLRNLMTGMGGSSGSNAGGRQSSIPLDPSERHHVVESPRLEATESLVAGGSTVSSGKAAFGIVVESTVLNSTGTDLASTQQEVMLPRINTKSTSSSLTARGGVAPPHKRNSSSSNISARPSFHRVAMLNTGNANAAGPLDDQPSFVVENASLMQQRTQAITPRPPSAPKTKVVTVVPKAHLELYEELQREVRSNLELHRAPHPQLSHKNMAAGGIQQQQKHQFSRFGNNQLSTLTSAAFLPTLGPAGQVSTMTERHSPGRTRVVAAFQEVSEFPSSQVLKFSDEKLREISLVRPDHTAEDEASWFAAAVKIQRFYRGSVDRERYRRLIHRNAEKQWERMCVERIWSCWMNFRGCRDAKLVVMDRIAFLRTEAHVKTIQLFARFHLAVELYGGLWQKAYEAELYRRRVVQIRTLSIIVTQSVARGRRVRKWLARRLGAVRKIQRFTRIFILYKLMRLAIFSRRIWRRDRLRLLNDMATRIQRWHRHWILQRRALRELWSRQGRLERHFVTFFTRDIKYWQDVKYLDDDLCRLTVQRWSVGLGVRRRMFALWTETQRRVKAARTLQRMFRFRHAKIVVDSLRSAKVVRDTVCRRRQEFREAAIDIQRAARKFLARKELIRRQERQQQKVAAACTIQRLARRVRQRKEFHKMRDDKSWKMQRYLLAQLRRYAVTKIQSLWRMRTTMKKTLEIRRQVEFNLVGRHVLAGRIQRLARSFVSKCRLAHSREHRVHMIAMAAANDRRTVAAMHIQSIMRMFLIRKDLREAQCKLVATITRKKHAAITIQTLWRRFASTQYVNQLQRARAYAESTGIAQEHLHAYATLIQSVVRAKILLQPRLIAAKEARRQRSVIRIQRTARTFLQRRQMERVAAEADTIDEALFSDEEKLFAALRIQKNVRGHKERVAYKTALRAALRIQCFVRCCLARRRARLLHEARRSATREILLQEQRSCL